MTFPWSVASGFKPRQPGPSGGGPDQLGVNEAPAEPLFQCLCPETCPQALLEKDRSSSKTFQGWRGASGPQEGALRVQNRGTEARHPRPAGPHPQGAPLSQPLWATPPPTGGTPETWGSGHPSGWGTRWLPGPRSVPEPPQLELSRRLREAEVLFLAAQPL